MCVLFENQVSWVPLIYIQDTFDPSAPIWRLSCPKTDLTQRMMFVEFFFDVFHLINV